MYNTLIKCLRKICIQYMRICVINIDRLQKEDLCILLVQLISSYHV